MKRNPFSAGRWVCGPQFFGRQELIHSLLDPNETCHWVIGKRRVGKTSLLREIERRVNTDHPEDFALFWDIQGSYDLEGLFDSLYDAVEDNQDLYPSKWEDFEFELDENATTPQMLKRISRAFRSAGMRFILLIDETEELMNIGKSDAVLLSKLRRFFQTDRNTLTIMTSSPTLEQLGRDVVTETSPFLHGFTVSYLGNFDKETSAALLKQGIEDTETIQRIYDITDGNPFETQLVAKHFYEQGTIDKVLLELETTPTLNQTIEVNFNLLTEDERTILKEIHCGPAPFQDFERALTVKLLRMGYLKQDHSGNNKISSYFQSKWLAVNLLDMPDMEPPADVMGGVVYHPDRLANFLTSIMDIYKILLELAQKGKAIAKTDEGYDLPKHGETFVFDPKSFNLRPEQREQRPWSIAMEEMSALMQQLLDREYSWSIFRFHQMVEKGPLSYTEKEFLDLMMLIAEEADLDKDS